MKQYILPLLFSFSLFSTVQQLQVEATLVNPSNILNDGYIELEVLDGTPPYQFKWSNRNTALDSPKAEGLIEEVPYSVTITDATGRQVVKEYTVEAKGITEHFNGTFAPIVSKMGAVLFWDPFAALGVYDPKIYAESKMITLPEEMLGVTGKYYVASREKAQESHVTKGELIAIITDGVEKRNVYANASGKIKYSVKEGDAINLSQIQAPGNSPKITLASIQLDSAEALVHPNGDFQTKNIPFIVVWLVLGALFFTLRMGFINLRGFRHAIELAKGKYDDPNAPGQVTHFQALATAVSGTVGLGNIAGVAVAISLGGAGATFWMIVAGLLGMSSKFVECTLGVKYRTINSEGSVFGGPMNYLRYGLGKRRNLKGLGKFLAALFAVLAIGASFGGGNMFQANQAFAVLANEIPALQGQGLWFGLLLAVLTGFVIIGGIKSIARVTEKIVPLMAIIYFLGAMTVILFNIENLGAAFTAIWEGAFSPGALKGGIIGVLIVGFQRAAFSNEAGVGSAAIAHSAAKTNNPPSEGFVSLLEPFVDTVVICTLTALVLIFTGMHQVDGIGGVELTSAAFGSVVSWFPYVLAAAVFLFAFSTMISWSYYGMRAWTYIFGKSRRAETFYKFLFLLFVVLGSSVSLGAVLDFSDMMILAMAFPNIIGLYILSGEVKKDLDEYLRKRKAGELFQKK